MGPGNRNVVLEREEEIVCVQVLLDCEPVFPSQPGKGLFFLPRFAMHVYAKQSEVRLVQ